MNEQIGALKAQLAELREQLAQLPAPQDDEQRQAVELLNRTADQLEDFIAGLKQPENE